MYERLEEGIAFLDVAVDRRCDASFLLLRISTNDDLPGGSLHHVSETLEMGFGHDAGVRVGRKSVIEAELGGCLLERLHEGVLS